MNHYRAPVREMKFALFDVLQAEALYRQLGFDNAQRDVMDAVLEDAAKFAENVLAPWNQVGDSEGCAFDPATGEVRTPTGFRDAYAQFVDGGWNGLTAPEAYGGQALPE